MLNTSLPQITEAAVEVFISKARLPESAILDYKRDYDLGTSKGKKGFLADICAFANNGGGHIIVGVDEECDEDGQKTGFPTFPPRGAALFDKSIAEDVLHASIEPRIGSFVHIQAVPGSWEDGRVYVIRVERTWNLPHCVRASEQRTFYRRSGTKSEPMDMDQIRNAFAGAAGIGDRVRDFHRKRVRRVLNGETTFPLAKARGKSIVHVIPLSFFAAGDRLSLDNVPLLRPSSGEGGTWSPVPNFDGRIAYAGQPKASSYIQVFRTGAVETVNTDLVYEEGQSLCLRVRQIEIDVLRSVQQAKEFFDSQPGLEPPCLVMFSVDGVEGSYIPPPNPSFDTSQVHPVELDQLEFLDIQLNDLSGEVAQVMRPIFDWLWQASGWPRSLSFDSEGRFTTTWL